MTLFPLHVKLCERPSCLFVCLCFIARRHRLHKAIKRRFTPRKILPSIIRFFCTEWEGYIKSYRGETSDCGNGWVKMRIVCKRKLRKLRFSIFCVYSRDLIEVCTGTFNATLLKYYPLMEDVILLWHLSVRFLNHLQAIYMYIHGKLIT
jgi:hypothetical protein